MCVLQIPAVYLLAILCDIISLLVHHPHINQQEGPATAGHQ